MSDAEDKLLKWVVPVYVVAYGDNGDEATSYVEKALDTTWFVGEDGIYSAEVIEDDVEEFDEENY
ncbi:MAG: hypothetical protein VW683_00165 [Betaproteobacteria bacterium]